MANALFNRVASNKPGYSAHNLSYPKKFTANIGILYPVMCDEVVPGDVFDIGNEAVVRSNPMVSPVMDEVHYKTHYFFVPYRLLDENWENFITGEETWDVASSMYKVADPTTISLPKWTPSATSKRDPGTLWDYEFGFAGVTPHSDSLPLDYPRRAYQFVWNEYFRDQQVMQEIDWTQAPGSDVDTDGNALTSVVGGDEDLRYCSFEKDYFTAALPWQQRGTSPSLAITITGDGGSMTLYNSADSTPYTVRTTSGASNVDVATGVPSGTGNARWGDPGLVGASVDMNQLRLSLAVQKFLELNARAGVRYKEFLEAHFGRFSGMYSDARLQRPEYIGGTMAPILISEVLQTAASDTGTSSQTPQGNMAGHGIQIDSNRVGRYRVPEFGLILGLMSFRAQRTYSQGINRQWTRRTRYDFYFPEWSRISEQAILQRELYVSTVKADCETTFGFAGAFDEMRVKYGMLHDNLRVGGTYDHWHMANSFASGPTLGTTFLIQKQGASDSVGTRHLAVPADPHFVVHFANVIRAIRPMPAIAEPSFGS